MVARASKKDNEAVFSEIYDRNLWSTAESHSGRGSTVEYTVSLREALPKILLELDVKVFIDAPCGDYNWMRLVPFATDCRYIGLDVVPKIVENNRSSFGGEKTEFHKLDITREALPHGDLLFCRDCLFHLSFGDIFKFLENFVRSETKYLMTSTHHNRDGFPNRDINSGDFRLLDLFAEPFCLGSSVIHRIDDFVPPDPAREMCVWPRLAIVEALMRYRGARAE